LELPRLLSLGAWVEESLSTRLDSVRAPDLLCVDEDRLDPDDRLPELEREDEPLFDFFEELPPERLLLLDRDFCLGILPGVLLGLEGSVFGAYPNPAVQTPMQSAVQNAHKSGSSNPCTAGKSRWTAAAKGVAGKEANPIREAITMAQTTRSSSSRSTRSRSSSNKATSRNGSSGRSRSSSKRSGSTGGRSGSSRSSTSASRGTSAGTKARQTAQNQTAQNGAVSKAGSKVAELASKAKTPLVAGGAAIAGIAGGVALKSRNDSRRPLKALRSVSLPKSFKNVDLSKVDLDSVMDAARQVRSIGEQVGDVVDAAEKTRKKHK
jgi:hypothetical protein